MYGDFSKHSLVVAQGQKYGGTREGLNSLLSSNWFSETSLHHVEYQRYGDFLSVIYVWHKAESMGRPGRIKLLNFAVVWFSLISHITGLVSFYTCTAIFSSYHFNINIKDLSLFQHFTNLPPPLFFCSLLCFSREVLLSPYT